MYLMSLIIAAIRNGSINPVGEFIPRAPNLKTLLTCTAMPGEKAKTTYYLRTLNSILKGYRHNENGEASQYK